VVAAAIPGRHRPGARRAWSNGAVPGPTTAAPSAAADAVLVCRGCCCGTVAKHPDVDHDAQLASLRDALPVGARLWVVDCLGACDRSNVVVVRRGGRRRWFGEVLDEADSAELGAWLAAPSGAPDARLPVRLAAREFEPDAASVVLRERPERGDELVELVCSTLGAEGLGRGGAWVLGVEGAVAEFAADGDPVEVAQRGRTVVATTPRGALRFDLGDDARAFEATAEPVGLVVLVLATSRDALAPPATKVTVLGPDGAAVGPAHRGDVLVDLGVGHESAAFCARLPEGELLGRVRELAGRPLSEALAELGPALVAASPDRVVLTALGRAEVRGPLPPPGGQSPTGPHTHLLPALLELGRELPVGLALPPGWAPAGSYHPPRPSAPAPAPGTREADRTTTSG
jgi:hypothetical protein